MSKIVSSMHGSLGQASATLTRGTVDPSGQNPDRVGITVSLAEPPIRQKLPDFDGFVSPFALIPNAQGTATRVELGPHTKADANGVYQTFEQGIPVTPEQLEAIEKTGIAVGVETNTGTVMLGDDSVLAPSIS